MGAQIEVCGRRENGGVLSGRTATEAVYFPGCNLDTEEASFLSMKENFMGIVVRTSTLRSKGVGVVSKCVGCRAVNNEEARRCPGYVDSATPTDEN